MFSSSYVNEPLRIRMDHPHHTANRQLWSILTLSGSF